MSGASSRRSGSGPRLSAELAAAVERVIAPAVTAANLYLEAVVVSAGQRPSVRVTVDLPETETGSLDADTLGEVSRSVSAALDEDDVMPGAYVLEVSTPGTSRPLTEPRHFRRARGRLIRFRLKDGTVTTGRLVEVSDDGARLTLEGGEIAVAEVASAKVEVEMKATAGQDEEEN